MWRGFCAFCISCRIVVGNGPVKFNTRAMRTGDRTTCFAIYGESIAIYFTCFRAGIFLFRIVTHTTAEKAQVF